MEGNVLNKIDNQTILENLDSDKFNELFIKENIDTFKHLVKVEPDKILVQIPLNLEYEQHIVDYIHSPLEISDYLRKLSKKLLREELNMNPITEVIKGTTWYSFTFDRKKI